MTRDEIISRLADHNSLRGAPRAESSGSRIMDVSSLGDGAVPSRKGERLGS